MEAGVVNRQAGSHRTPGGVDVKVNILVRIFRFQEQQLGHDQVGHVVFHRSHHKNHPLFQ
jgi:hypothetical protein